MSDALRRLLPLAALALAACGGSPAPAPWLTAPSRQDHAARWFPIGPGSRHADVGCDGCHPAGSASFRDFQCTSCHDHHDDAAALGGVHAGLPGYAFESAACYRCHADGHAALPDHARVFPIGAGTAHAAAACADCHVDVSDRRVLGCAGCHPHEQATADAAHRRVADYAFASDRCARCHPDSQVSRVSSHLPFRVDAGGHRGPEGGACLACHPASRSGKAWAADFRVVECTGCHAEPATQASHAGVADYAGSTDACLRCHPAGGVDHGPFYPIEAASVHAAATCADCHPDPRDHRQLTCAGCHPHERATVDGQHLRVADYGADAARCTRCHPDATVKPVATHLPFAVDAGRHRGPEGGACLTCHPATRPASPWTADFGFTDCLGCHARPLTDASHDGVTDYAWATEACLRCHPAGTIDHTGFFPIAAGSKHESTTCAQCHPDPTRRKVLGCAGCHPHEQATADAQHAAVPDYAFAGAACVRCHADSQVDAVAAHLPFKVETAGKHVGAGGGACLACHPASQAARPWAADWKVRDCLGCHAQAATDAQHVQVSGYVFATASCLGCHPEGTSVDHAPLFPIAAGSAHATTRCADCHVSTTDRTVLGCAGCHPHDAAAMATAHAAVADYAFDPARCVRCHADSQVSRVAAHLPFQIQPGTKHAGPGRGECLRCHPTSRTDKAWAADFTVKSCPPCHDQGTMDAKHLGRTGYAYDTAACLTCHPTGVNADGGL